MDPTYRYRAVPLRVIDADTYVLDIDLGMRVHTHAEIRLRGWDCPELNSPEGREAALAAGQLLFPGWPVPTAPQVVVETFRDRRSFSRWIADVYIDGRHLGELLAADGHATANEGA